MRLGREVVYLLGYRRVKPLWHVPLKRGRAFCGPQSTLARKAEKGRKRRSESRCASKREEARYFPGAKHDASYLSGTTRAIPWPSRVWGTRGRAQGDRESFSANVPATWTVRRPKETRDAFAASLRRRQAIAFRFRGG